MGTAESATSGKGKDGFSGQPQTPWVIFRNNDGTELHRTQKGPGRPYSNAFQDSDGNWNVPDCVVTDGLVFTASRIVVGPYNGDARMQDDNEKGDAKLDDDNDSGDIESDSDQETRGRNAMAVQKARSAVLVDNGKEPADTEPLNMEDRDEKKERKVLQAYEDLKELKNRPMRVSISTDRYKPETGQNSGSKRGATKERVKDKRQTGLRKKRKAEHREGVETEIIDAETNLEDQIVSKRRTARREGVGTEIIDAGTNLDDQLGRDRLESVFNELRMVFLEEHNVKSEIQKENIVLQEKLDKALKEKKIADQDIKDITDSANDNAAKTLATEKELSKIQIEFNELEVCCKDLRKKITVQITAQDELEKKMQEKEDEHQKKMQDKEDEHQKKMQEKEDEHEKLLQKKEDEYQKKLQELEKALHDANEGARKTLNETRDAREKLPALEAEVAAIKQENQALKQENEDLKQKNGRLLASVTAMMAANSAT